MRKEDTLFEKIKKVFDAPENIIVVMMLSCLFLAMVGFVMQQARFEKIREKFDNGTCACGGEYKLVVVTRRRHYYVCDKCGREIASEIALR